MAAVPEQLRDPDRLGDGIQLLEGRGSQRDPAFELPGVLGRGGGLFQDPAMIRADPLGGVRHLIPQFKHAGQQRKALGGRDRPARLRRRLPGGNQRPGGVVRRVPVVSHLDGGPAGRNQRRVGVDGRGEAAVQPSVLARQQVFVHRLADQLVPERVAIPAPVQHVGDHRGPHGASQRRVIQASHRPEQRVPGHRSAGAGDPQHLLGVFWQPAYAVEQQVAEGFRQLLAQLAVTAEQGLDEQRVALGTVVQRVGQVAGWLAAEDADDQLVGVVPRQAGQFDPLHPGDPVQ